MTHDARPVTQRRRWRALVAGVALSALAVFPAAARVFDPETFTLKNGMQVVVVNNPRAPVVSHMVWYKVGSADEEPGKSGLAHYLEHLMFKGTAKMKPSEFSRTVARNGGRDNAFTAYDYTAYFENIARDRLELVMGMEADRMVNLRLTDDIVLPERKVIQEERRQRTENEPASRLYEQLYSLLFVHHPYGTPIIGWMHEIEKLTTQDALDFYKRHYAPNNAILVVAGDITAAELKPLAEKTYGKIKPSKDIPARVRVTEPPTEGARRITLTDDQVRQPNWMRIWKAPSYSAGEKQYASALEVLESILADGATSRLYKSLVVEQKIAAGVNLSYNPNALDLGTLSISATPAPGQDVAAVEKALDAELAKLLSGGVTDAEVASAKVRLRRDAVFARDSLQGPAYAFGVALTTGQTVADVEAWPDRIAAVTREQVEQAAKLVLGQDNHVTGILLPAATPAPVQAAAPAAPPAAPAAPAKGGTK
ncbi:M16 family metallopeptidase [Niveispirillum cyanobacteriorum]|uniref:Peptidase M16 n=1 Tax=Niveispirillum cyanobacteriorum TaxID=1612173 RepID=A0A2K9N6T3_9PROT|nr:pitrilysin family protein [Niveispirillum cyanobacteriorum]AUN28841.1 peptidase M16 [Niveispirillum cyanobacteriorum]GGE69910.1 peptidase M16 [Niveispirillum cyanobacteriorum]